MKEKVFQSIFAALLFCHPALAHAQSNDAPTFFELSGAHLEKIQPVTTQSLQGKPALLSFWRSDCAPCRKELPILTEAATLHPELEIVLISLQDEKTARTYAPESLPGNLHMWVAGGNGRDVVRTYGNDTPTIPFAAILHNDGSRCDTHKGVIGTNLVDEWMKRC